MIALWILLGVLLVLLALLLVPISLSATYGEALTVYVRYLFWQRRLVPPEEEKPKKQGEKKPKAPAETAEKKSPLDKLRAQLKAEGFSGFMRLVGDFLKQTGSTAAHILRHVCIREFDLYVMVGGADAAEAAILYGQVSGVVYAAAELLFTRAKCKKRRVSVDLDYDVQASYARLSARAQVRPLFLVYYGLQYLIRTLPFFKRFL